MKILYVLLVLTILSSFSCKETGIVNDQTSDQTSEAISYDSLLAREYGADDYGMKKYVIAFLKKGPNRDLSKEESAELQRAHMDNIGKMSDAGKLIMAGPFFGDGELRGIYIFDVENIEEAEALTNSDPAIKAGSLEMELIEWYGSAGLMGVKDLHKKVAKIEI